MGVCGWHMMDVLAEEHGCHVCSHGPLRYNPLHNHTLSTMFFQRVRFCHLRSFPRSLSLDPPQTPNPIICRQSCCLMRILTFGPSRSKGTKGGEFLSLVRGGKISRADNNVLRAYARVRGWTCADHASGSDIRAVPHVALRLGHLLVLRVEG